MCSRRSAKAHLQKVRAIAFAAVVLLSQSVMGQAPAVKASYDKTVCSELERICTTEEDGPGTVRCRRPEFARALLGCVDLWESEQVCLDRLGATEGLRSVDLDSYYSQLERLDSERQEMRRRAWIWGVLGVIGWGVAAGFLVGWAMK